MGLSALVLLASSTTLLAFQTEDLDQLLLQAKQVVVDPDEVFSGLGGKWKRLSSVDHEIEIQFDQLERNVWRAQQIIRSKQGNADVVAIRDEGFSFIALRKGDAAFAYEILGMDDDVHRQVREGVPFPFRDCVLESRGVTLSYLLKHSTEFKVIERLAPETHQGFRVVGIKFWANEGGKIFRGTVAWIPEKKNMLRSLKLMADLGEIRKDIFMGDVTIEYRIYKDSLLPWRIVSKASDGQAAVYELDEVRAANPDRSYYTAESLGLETPRKPRPKWLNRAALGILCLFLGCFYWFRINRR